MPHPLSGVYTRRIMSGITVKACAHEIGVSPRYFHMLENGESVMQLPRALTLAKFFGCTVEQLGQEPTGEEQLAAMRKRTEDRKLKQDPVPPISQPNTAAHDLDPLAIKTLAAWDDEDAKQAANKAHLEAAMAGLEDYDEGYVPEQGD